LKKSRDRNTVINYPNTANYVFQTRCAAEIRNNHGYLCCSGLPARRHADGREEIWDADLAAAAAAGAAPSPIPARLEWCDIQGIRTAVDRFSIVGRVSSVAECLGVLGKASADRLWLTSDHLQNLLNV